VLNGRDPACGKRGHLPVHHGHFDAQTLAAIYKSEADEGFYSSWGSKQIAGRIMKTKKKLWGEVAIYYSDIDRLQKVVLPEHGQEMTRFIFYNYRRPVEIRENFSTLQLAALTLHAKAAVTTLYFYGVSGNQRLFDRKKPENTTLDLTIDSELYDTEYLRVKFRPHKKQK